MPVLIQLTRTTDAPVKPRFAEPCNGCGHCCERQVCDVGCTTFNLAPCDAPCPALEYDETDSRFYCGLVRRPAHYITPGRPDMERFNPTVSGLLLKLIDAGGGCGAPDFDEPLAHARVTRIECSIDPDMG